jgi:hypothetical protein
MLRNVDPLALWAVRQIESASKDSARIPAVSASRELGAAITVTLRTWIELVVEHRSSSR